MNIQTSLDNITYYYTVYFNFILGDTKDSLYGNCLKGFLNIGISQLVVINCYETSKYYDNYGRSYIILSISLPVVIFWLNSLN